MFYLHILTNNFQHPPYTFQTMDEAIAAVEAALEEGWFFYKEGDFLGTGPGEVSLATGPGTIYRVLSEERQASRARETQTTVAKVKAGLIAPPLNDDNPVQIILLNGSATVDPPLGFPDWLKAETVVKTLRRTGKLRHRIAEDDYIAVHAAPGCVALQVSKAGAEARHRVIAEQFMRARQAEGSAPKKLILGN